MASKNDFSTPMGLISKDHADLHLAIVQCVDRDVKELKHENKSVQFRQLTITVENRKLVDYLSRLILKKNHAVISKSVVQWTFYFCLLNRTEEKQLIRILLLY